MKQIATILMALATLFVVSYAALPPKQQFGSSNFGKPAKTTQYKPKSEAKETDNAKKAGSVKDATDKLAANMPSTKANMVEVAESDSFGDKVLKRFYNFYTTGVQEKLYIHNDKPYYCAGDTLWFKGYVSNAITGVPSDFSKYIYVELRNSIDSLVSRVKIKADSAGRFANCLELPAKLSQGDYTLCGYTRWMNNLDSDFFFGKKIKIVNPIDDSFNISVAYTKSPDGEIMAVVTLLNSFGETLPDMRVSYRTLIDGKPKGGTARSDAKGEIRLPLQKPTDELRANVLEFSADNELVKGTKASVLPVFGKDFDLQFFPEGGNLIADVIQNVAFKAIGANGLGVNVDMKLFDDKGELVGQSSSVHAGMGRFTLIPSATSIFYAEATSDGVTKRFELPKTISSGCAIQVQEYKGNMVYKVSFTPDLDPAKFGVVLQSRGRVIAAEPLKADKLTKIVSKNMLPAGISQLSIIDMATQTPVAQRIFFVRDKAPAMVSITPDRSSYDKRQQVALAINVKDAKGNPLMGDFSMTVTDSGTIKPDSTAIDIVSYTLLSSDIKGYIENPAYYFSDTTASGNSNLDLLMMTQGWRRFDVGSVLKGDLPSVKYPHENSQSISGEVKGFFGGDAKKPKIVIFQPKSGYMEMVELGNSNKFNLVGLDFKDSTSFIIQALSKGGSNRFVTLNIHPQKFPAVSNFMAKPFAGELSAFVPQSFITQSKQRFYYEGGMKVVDIEAVSVVTSRKEQASTLYNVNPTRSIGQETLEQYAGSDIYTILRMMPGVLVNGTDISIRNSQDPPMLYVDNMQVDLEYLDNISISDVKSIDLVVGPEAGIFGLGASGGVILVNLKDGTEINKNIPTLPSIQNVSQLGYKKPALFYQPKYEVAQNRNKTTPDLRSTILWNPAVATDSSGNALVRFFTADTPTTYDIVIEGLSDQGHIVRATSKIKR